MDHMGIRQIAALLIALCTVLSPPASAEESLDVLVIGDSQLWGNKFGFDRFFSDFAASCPGVEELSPKPLYSILSVSGSGFHDWTREALGPFSDYHGDTCNLDEDFHYLGNYIPRGAIAESLPLAHKVYQFPGMCEQGMSAIEGTALLKPNLVIATFLGAHQEDDEHEEGDEVAELERGFNNFLEQLDPNSACVVMTNPPLAHRKHFPQEYRDLWMEGIEKSGGNYEEWYKKKLKGSDNAQKQRRETAERIHTLVRETGRCQLVEGFDEETLLPLFQNPKDYFGIHTGEMEAPHFYYDPFHMTEKGSYEFFRLKGPELCSAIKEALR